MAAAIAMEEQMRIMAEELRRLGAEVQRLHSVNEDLQRAHAYVRLLSRRASQSKAAVSFRSLSEEAESGCSGLPVARRAVQH